MILAARSLDAQFGVACALTSAIGRQAAERFEAHIGSLNHPDALGADNERIDADRAAAYADTAKPS